MRLATTTLIASFLLGTGTTAIAQQVGSEEFGLTPRELRARIEGVEAAIETCMRAEGFAYSAVDFLTVRKGMSADKSLPGIPDEDFVERYGFGISTFYTGLPPQETQIYSPAKIGLGEQNVSAFTNLSDADKAAYNYALLGSLTGDTFARGLEKEDFSRTGGCTREAIEKYFSEDEMARTYFNPLDAAIRDDPRMKKAIEQYAEGMREAGLPYDDPDQVEVDIQDRLAALTQNGTVPPQKMTDAQLDELYKLQEFERQVAVANLDLLEEYVEPVDEAIMRERFSSKLAE